MRCWVVICSFLLLSGISTLSAQEFGGDAEVFGFVGYGRILDDEGSLGDGVNFAGGVGHRFTRRLGVEAEVAGFRHSRDIGADRGYKGSGVLVLGNAVIHLSNGRVQPYLLGGAGVLHYRNKPQSDVSSRTVTGTGFAMDAGVGLKIFASEHISIRPDFRLVAGSAGDAIESPFIDLRAAIGIGYHW
jgi:opacity protein-like surface antigen